MPITQATSATFADLFTQLTFLCFIQTGTKWVVCPVNGEMIAEQGDLIVFPAGSIVTLENRPLLIAHYRADGVYFNHDLIDAVFADQGPGAAPCGIQIVRALPHRPDQIFALIQQTLGSKALPLSICRRRLPAARRDAPLCLHRICAWRGQA